MIIKDTIKFLLFGSIFIACCTVAMCIETNLLLHVPLNGLSFYCFVFGATLLQYNLHYLVKIKAVNNSSRLIWSLENKPIHRILIIAALLLIVGSMFTFHLHHFIFLLGLGGIACLYSLPILPFRQKKRLKDFGLLKIIVLALLWTLVTVWFPVNQMKYNDVSFQMVFFRRFTFMFILCLLFDIRDVEIDGSEKIKTLPVIIGNHYAYLLCYALLLIFVLLSFLQFLYIPEAIPLTIMLFSAIATLFTIEYSRNHNSDYVYLACVDGMMMLQAAMVILSSI